jgi:hypothetical protein
MFKKPLAHQSNATPLRSSARRQLLASLTGQYPSLIPSEDVEGLSGKEVGRLVLPEGVRTTSFETSGGVEGVSLYLMVVSNVVLISSNSGLILIMVTPFGCHSVEIQRNSYQPVNPPSHKLSSRLTYSLPTITSSPVCPITNDRTAQSNPDPDLDGCTIIHRCRQIFEETIVITGCTNWFNRGIYYRKLGLGGEVRGCREDSCGRRYERCGRA